MWFREHRPAANATSAVVVAAQETSLTPAGVFNPYDGLRVFRRAYQATQISGETFNIDLVYHALVRAVEATLTAVDTSRCVILDVRGLVTERWSDFAAGLSHTYLARCHDGITGSMRFALADLNTLVAQLNAYGAAYAASVDRAACLAVDPRGTVRLATPHPPASPGVSRAEM